MHFDGSVKRQRNVSLRGKSREEEKGELLRRARKEREARAADKEKRNAAAAILDFYCKRSAFNASRAQARADFDKRSMDLLNLGNILAAARKPLPTPVAVVEGLLSQLVIFYNPNQDVDRLERLIRLFLESCSSQKSEWNFLTLRDTQPFLYETEATRFCRICICSLVHRPLHVTPAEQIKLVQYLGVLSAILPTTEEWREVDCRVLLQLGKDTGDEDKAPVMYTNRYILECRRSRSLPWALSREVKRSINQEELDSISLPLCQTSLMAAGFPIEGKHGLQVPPQLRELQEQVAGQTSLSLVTSARLFATPALMALLSPLRQHRARGIAQLIQAWDGVALKDRERVERLDVAEKMMMTQNLLDMCRLLLEQGNIEASLVPSIVRALAFNVKGMPLAWMTGVKKVPRQESGMEVDEEGDWDMDVEVGGTESLEDSIAGLLKSKHGSGVPHSPAEHALVRSAQDTLRGLCGGRDLPRLFDRLFDASQNGFDEEQGNALLTLCSLVAHVLYHSEESLPHIASQPAASGTGLVSQILNLLAYHATGIPFVQHLWGFLQPKLSQCRFYTTDASEHPNQGLAKYHPALYLFFSVYSHQLMALDDEEFYSRQWPLSLPQVLIVTETLRQLLYQQYWADAHTIKSARIGSREPFCIPLLEYLQLKRSATMLFNQLYQRHTRRPFSLPDQKPDPRLWHWFFLTPHDLDQETAMNHGEAEQNTTIETILDTEGRLYAVLTRIPQVLPFEQRVRIFNRLLATDKRNAQDEAQLMGHRIRVRRQHIYEDSYATLNHLGHGLRGRVQVTLINELGMEEAGIDGGGVFKEYMDTLTRRAFDPQYALFKVTPDHLLYPNPLSELVGGEDHLSHFEFLGRVLAKAVYESILVEPQFALFFLQRLAGKLNETDDLYSMDPELYRHIMSLKRLKSQGARIGDLALNFEVITQDETQASRVRRVPASRPVSLLAWLGGRRQKPTQVTTHSIATSAPGKQATELIPGGRNVPVTNENVYHYIQLMANHKLNVEINAQAHAFLRGFRDLIPTAWLRMFGAEELQKLLTGDKRAIDIDVLRVNTRYSGGYHPSQPIIQWFWDALRSFQPDEQSAFLMFVTSCSRPPLLGFGSLNPPFCIQKVPLQEQGVSERLPSSATCMNLLKLPAYTKPEVLRDKLLYAVSAGAGFELS